MIMKKITSVLLLTIQANHVANITELNFDSLIFVSSSYLVASKLNLKPIESILRNY